jgi:hypothetical protein
MQGEMFTTDDQAFVKLATQQRNAVGLRLMSDKRKFRQNLLLLLGSMIRGSR